MSSLTPWWRAQGHYAWLVDYIRSRGLERQTRIITGVVTACLGMMPVVMLLSPSGAQGTVGRGVAVAVGATCLIMGLLWTIHWPSPTQSLAYVLVSNVCCSAACLVLSNPLAGLTAASCFSILASYVAFYHSARIYIVTMSFAAFTAVTLGVELAVSTGDLVLAISKVFLVLLSVAALPFVTQLLMAYLGSDVANSEVDPLTGLSNRRGFDRRANELLAASKSSSSATELAAIMIDLDDFKKVNDTYGHATGDRALVTVGEILRRNCHPHRAVVARVGGEEFLIADTCGVAVDVTAERIRREIAESPFASTASVGAAIGPLGNASGHVVTLDDLVAMADAAMYAAKRAGGNRVAFLRAATDADAPYGPDVQRDGTAR